jgi:hypothetical protein
VEILQNRVPSPVTAEKMRIIERLRTALKSDGNLDFLQTLGSNDLAALASLIEERLR